MSLSQIQKQIDDTVQPYAKPYWEPLSILARITEEVGEIARILNAKYGDKPLKKDESPDELSGEIADVMYALFCLANREGINLDQPMQDCINKLLTRDKDRFDRKS